jgi:hypothetical protein
MRDLSSVLHLSIQNKILKRLRDKLILTLCVKYRIRIEKLLNIIP